jgi:phage tail-like protein
MPATGQREDPLVGFNFAIEIDGMQMAWFRECAGLESEHEVVEVKQVDKKGKPSLHKLPGKMKWPNISLKRGLTSDMGMWDWRKKVEEGKMKDARKTGSIVVYDTELKEVARYNFENGWPSKVSASGLLATGNDMALEEVVIVHEGMMRVK